MNAIDLIEESERLLEALAAASSALHECARKLGKNTSAGRLATEQAEDASAAMITRKRGGRAVCGNEACTCRRPGRPLTSEGPTAGVRHFRQDKLEARQRPTFFQRLLAKRGRA